MALNVQNKNFLSLLNKLGIDINEFPDKSFDGIFDNVPCNIDYFFEWFLENITPDNVLTKSEQGVYFELENNGLLSTEEEILHILSIHNPTFDELHNFDPNSIKTCLSDNLKQLKKNYKLLNCINQTAELKHNKVKRMASEAKGRINFHKKKLEDFHVDLNRTFCIFNEKTNQITMSLIRLACEKMSLDGYKVCLKESEFICKKLKNCLASETQSSFSINNMYFIPKVEESLINLEIVNLLSQGFLKCAQVEMEALDQIVLDVSTHLDSSGHKNFFISPMECDNFNFTERCEEIRALELKLHKKIKKSPPSEVRKMSNECYLKIAETNRKYIDKLKVLKALVESNSLKNSWLHHILLEYILSMEAMKEIREDFSVKINKLEVMSYNNVVNFGLKKRKCDDLEQGQCEYPFLVTFKEAKNPENESSTLINQLANDFLRDSFYEILKFQTDLKLFVNRLMSDIFCGPTSQLLNVPLEILSFCKKCKEESEDLSRKIKHLVNAYLETKTLIARNDRKGLLLWIDFLANPKELDSMVNNISQHDTSTM